MDERTRTPLRLAGRIWRIQRERLEYSNRGEIYPQPGAASPQDDVRAGISGVAEETRHRSRCFMTAGVCRPAKAGLQLSSQPYPPLTSPSKPKTGLPGTPVAVGSIIPPCGLGLLTPCVLRFVEHLRLFSAAN